MKHSRKYLLSAGIGLGILAGFTACHTTTHAAQIQGVASDDPAAQNMVPLDSSGQPIAGADDSGQQAPQGAVNESQQQAYQYSGGAPVVRQAPPSGQPGEPTPQAPSPGQYAAQQGYAQDNGQGYADDGQDPNGQDPNLVDAGEEALEATDAPPELPIYDQPPAPDPNYLWTPGYWGYAPAGGYYWIPGAWVAAPYVGALWTPGYWGFYGGRYRFYHGYWGPHIGFYGGINYGFGYFGTGFVGGYWNGSNFFYNREVVNVGRVGFVYSHAEVIPNRGNRIAFNGGARGIQARPNVAERAAMRGPRTPAMASQRDNARSASQNHAQFFSANKGRPSQVTATRGFAADRNVARPASSQLPSRVTGSTFRPGNTTARPANEARPGGQFNNQNQGNRQPNQQFNGARPNQPGQQNRPGVRPAPQADNRNFQQQARPEQQARPQQQARPEQQARPQQENRNFQQQRPEQQARPQQQPRMEQQSRPAPQARPAPQPRPAPQARPAPAPREEGRPR